jgi:hypothetical protein
MKQCWITYIKRKTEKFRLKKRFACISFRLFFFLHFAYFLLFSLQIFSCSSNFSVHFRFTLIFLPRFAYFTFVFASDFCCFASMWIKWNHAFFSLLSETKFSLQFQFSFPKRKRGRTLIPSEATPLSPGLEICILWPLRQVYAVAMATISKRGETKLR